MVERVHRILLGCAKEDHDSGIVVGLQKTEIAQLVDVPDGAGVINTCCFVHSATADFDMVGEVVTA